MPDQESTHQPQRMLVWAFAGYGADGQPTVETFYTEYGVRWNNRKSEARGPDGTKISLDADIEADVELSIGSIAWQGSQEDLEELIPTTGTGTDIEPTADLTDLYDVVTVDAVTDVRGRATSYGYGLKRHSGTMPDQV